MIGAIVFLTIGVVYNLFLLFYSIVKHFFKIGSFKILYTSQGLLNVGVLVSQAALVVVNGRGGLCIGVFLVFTMLRFWFVALTEFNFVILVGMKIQSYLEVKLFFKSSKVQKDQALEIKDQASPEMFEEFEAPSKTDFRGVLFAPFVCTVTVASICMFAANHETRHELTQGFSQTMLESLTYIVAMVISLATCSPLLVQIMMPKEIAKSRAHETMV
ncbi:predicted protein [Nematostella vectensis]|uniref:Uncharacterized protein n=1 Tax=Nematostella vectensis TaxID=45351 RepID=A7T2J5_NEMVE|nr:uncharacterized protein LOC125557132 isoform X1 [Nematostella vectensis]EDO29823.1 predicted protein [Nematostella vectensis]|eukprot:XP_001621923.1 hypothetical protein NEMVEDRAFT_v1g248614 [Nematostella vectensis]